MEKREIEGACMASSMQLQYRCFSIFSSSSLFCIFYLVSSCMDSKLRDSRESKSVSWTNESDSVGCL